VNSASQQDSEIATLAGGCFWCLEAAYRQLNGVLSVQPEGNDVGTQYRSADLLPF